MKAINLHLPLKKQWFEMTKQMIKEEEYLKAKQIVQEYEKQLNISVISNRNCKNCGHRYGSINYGTCMLSGYYCTVERRSSSQCGRNFENWTQRSKSKGIKGWLQSLWYGW